MKSTTGKYSEEAKKLLSGKIRLFSYSKEVLQVLADRKQETYDPSWIRLVVCECRNHPTIWDAVVKVIADRKQAKENEDALTAEIKELVEEV